MVWDKKQFVSVKTVFSFARLLASQVDSTRMVVPHLSVARCAVRRNAFLLASFCVPGLDSSDVIGHICGLSRLPFTCRDCQSVNLSLIFGKDRRDC